MARKGEAALEAVIDRYEREKGFSGAFLVEARGDEVLSGARGFAHRGFAVPNDVDTRFDTASVTKIFTAAAVFRLVDRGLVGLDERVRDIVDLGDSPIPREVTLRHCLTHSSGIADDADEESGEAYEDLWKAKPCYAVRTTVDFLPQFAHKTPLFAPGSGCRYNNCAFVLAGLVLEARSGASYRSVVEREVFAATGMSRSGFFAKDGVEPALAEGYADCPDAEGGRAQVRKNVYAFPPIGSPDAGAYATVRDLRRFFAALEGDAYLSPESRSSMLAPVLAYSRLGTGGERKMGFALEFDYDDRGNLVRFGKDGVNPGVAAIAMRYPRSKGFVALLSNRDADVWSLCRELASAAGMD